MTEILDEPPRRGKLPMFTQPAPTPTWSATMGDGPAPDSPIPYLPDSLETDTDPSEREVPRSGRTSTSGSRTDGPKQATQKEVGQLVAGLVVALAVGASMFLRWRSGNRLRLRQPTDEQAAEVGQPLGRILVRHVPLPQLVPDLADAIAAAVGLNRFLDDGPLVLYAPTDAGLPADLTQEPTS